MIDAKTSAAIDAHAQTKQLRAQTTRQQLVDAAREIFARDGFVQARLEDVAAAAGRTRGAFYAHFRDKEDLFFAIFEEDKQRDRELMRTPLKTASSREQRVEILVQHLMQMLKNRRRMLLILEFKMYAIRHPKKQKRLAELVADMCSRCGEEDVSYLVPELRGTAPGKKRAQAAQFGALLDGLALNQMFDPESVDQPAVLRKLREGVASILDNALPDEEA